jgi:sulfite oxidase
VEPFDKHPRLIVRSRQPFNAEPPCDLLRENLTTPTELFFVRNHGSIPEISPEHYRLSVAGMLQQRLRLSLEEIRGNFSKSTVTATLQCAGNRRDELIEVAPVPGELPWSSGAIGNARWSGAPLGEVLQVAGVDPEARHASFSGLDEIEMDGERFGFGGSIPIEKAMSEEVVLAYEMNGEPLTPKHGAPLRVVAPGYIGARSVKWLSSIELQAEPSSNYYQARAYKLFPPQVDEETADWEKGLMLGELSVNSVICQPTNEERVPPGPVSVLGYAITGGGRSVERVDVSGDGGESWVTADLLEGGGSSWAWRFWAASLELGPGEHEIVARAWDSAANTQPELSEQIWNFKGYMENSWHRVKVFCRD